MGNLRSPVAAGWRSQRLSGAVAAGRSGADGASASPLYKRQAVELAQRRIGGLNRGKRHLLPGPQRFDALDQRAVPS